MSSPRRSPSCPTRSSPRPSSAPISRRLFGTVGVAPDIEFVATDLDPLAGVRSAVGTNTYQNHGSLSLLFEDLLGDVRFRSPWRDLDKSVAHVAGRGARTPDAPAASGARWSASRSSAPVFYQISRAYIVGRLVGRALLAAAGDRAQEQRRRRAGGRGDARRGRRQHRLQLHALLLPRRPRARGRGGGVPAIDHAAQAGERAVHGARACAPGQDRALPRADAPPRAHRRPVHARRRASAAW